jgi:4-hydroxythreonine-4-phosphate dehydrogenase
MKNRPILIVSGEPNSVFLEIFFKSINNKKYKSPLVLICCERNLKQQMKKFKFKKGLNLLEIKKIKIGKLDNKKINIINVDYQKSTNNNLNAKLKSKYIKESFQKAFDLIRNGFTDKMINGPINKKTFLNKKYLGITEYISKNFNQKKIGMLIYNKSLSVCPLTTHLPLKLVSRKITKKLIEDKIQIINDFYKKIFKKRPKIAVTGLNPHCESILRFNEDEKIVKLAIKSSIKKRINVKGPFPADTIFLKTNRKKFDVILGMYHDQVLPPLKTLFEFDAINITMGLPFLRVSPDHGPNQKMYGQNKSNPISLIKALNFLDQK